MACCDIARLAVAVPAWMRPSGGCNAPIDTWKTASVAAFAAAAGANTCSCSCSCNRCCSMPSMLSIFGTSDPRPVLCMTASCAWERATATGCLIEQKFALLTEACGTIIAQGAESTMRIADGSSGQRAASVGPLMLLRAALASTPVLHGPSSSCAIIVQLRRKDAGAMICCPRSLKELWMQHGS